MLRTVTATRYVAPLREGGSLPAIVEADDLGTYVLKFTGAGQGPKALVAEIVTGELARRIGLRVPELVLVELDPRLSLAEPDEEIQDLLRASAGLNLGVDYLPGSFGFDPMAKAPDRDLAARVAWLDALTANVDRSWRNPNLLVWHGDIWLIDHGAALFFHHNWDQGASAARRPYPRAADHVLLPFARDVAAADGELAPRVTPELVAEVVDLVPAAWLAGEPGFGSADEVRAAYRQYFADRLAPPRSWVDALEEARAASV
jgi:hypothetical protein